MKQFKLFLTLLIIAAMSVSCEKEDNQKNNDAVLPTKMIKTDAEGKKATSLFEYDGTKIKKITETSDLGTTVFTYTYTGDNITKIVEQNEDGIVKSQSFIYVDDKLMMWTENYDTDSETCFACEISVTIDYNTDGSQTIKYYAGKDKEVRNIVIVTHANNSAINAAQTFRSSNGPSNAFIYGLLSTSWSNPFQNILGWTRLELLDPLLYSKKNLSDYSLDFESASSAIYRLSYTRGGSNDPARGFPYPTETIATDLRTEKIVYKIEYHYNK